MRRTVSNEFIEALLSRESGYGRYDVRIIPKDISKLGIVIEYRNHTVGGLK